MRNATNKERTRALSVAQICPRYHPHIGGVESHVKEISERLINHGINVDVITTDPVGDLPPTEAYNGVTIKRFKSWAPGEAYYYSGRLGEYLKKNSLKYDIIHAHSYHAFPALHASMNKGKAKLVFNPHYHGEGHTPLRKILHMPYRYVGNTIFRRSDEVISVSNYEKTLLIRDFKLEKDEIKVIPNGINKQEFKAQKRGEKDHGKILSVGRLEEYKGIQHVIRVMPMLGPDITLDIVGKGPYKDAILSLIKTLKLEDRVKLSHGLTRQELVQKYVDSDLFILLSKNEAFGLTVAESLAAGTPCIVANTSALTEWVDGETCYGVDYPIDYSHLKSLVENVIGKRVQKHKLLDWDDVVVQLISLYKRIDQS